ncbi:5'-3' exonuclease PLD4 [Talpa occidentalis]|uniref:5'-3' exonuclease PLD4 n=1 Tax=Talpa occidentalis TaxID=50954 RepID=UPI00188F2AE5|nr:5'-3' exonuclease PLD4 [Talpa occidentalis]
MALSLGSHGRGDSPNFSGSVCGDLPGELSGASRPNAGAQKPKSWLAVGRGPPVAALRHPCSVPGPARGEAAAALCASAQPPAPSGRHQTPQSGNRSELGAPPGRVALAAMSRLESWGPGAAGAEGAGRAVAGRPDSHLLPAASAPAPPGGQTRPDLSPPGSPDACRLVLVESTPQGLPPIAGRPAAQPLAQAWLQLLDAAQEHIHVASFYWSLTGRDVGVNDSSSQLGEGLLQRLEQLLARNVSLAVVTSKPALVRDSTDLQVLAAQGAQVRQVPMRQLTGGVLHSKFWVVDGRHVYVGSANMDWRSLTQVKELGAVLHNCSSLAQDLEKTFQTYWALGAPQARLPTRWPQSFSSHINRSHPLRGRFDGVPTTAYFSASPPALCPGGRTRDLDALLAVMGRAREFLYASVMEYFPTSQFSHPSRYWPVLDTALRTAAVSRGVRVRLLVSCWLHTDPRMFPFLRSLQALSNPAAGVSVDVKIFIVPVGNHSSIPFSRVNHSKFLVTEQTAYIGTSNWSEEYFSSTAGVGLVVSQEASHTPPGVATVQEQLRQLFERDWSSPYAVGLDSQARGQDCVWHA